MTETSSKQQLTLLAFLMSALAPPKASPTVLVPIRTFSAVPAYVCCWQSQHSLRYTYSCFNKVSSGKKSYEQHIWVGQTTLH